MRPYFEQNGITIYHGDARDVLCDVELQANLLLTDPPYGMTYENNARKGLVGDAQRQGIRLFRQVLRESMPRLVTPCHAYVFCHWESYPDFYDAMASYVRAKNLLVWDKRNFGPGDCEADYAHSYELVVFAHVGGRRLLRGGRKLAVMHFPILSGKERAHPTEKPEALFTLLIDKSTEADELVLDPFMGSGAALAAARKLGRRAVGIEIDESYCEAAARRLDQTELF